MAPRRPLYGLTLDQYRDLTVEQSGLCGICGLLPDEALRVDYDFAAAAVRGLLCAGCGYLLGFAKDDIARLQAAARYLGAP